MRFLLLFFSLSLCYQLSAQMVYLEPTSAGPDDAATLYFNAAAGNGELVGSTKVYAHHGVVVDGPTSTEWSNVIGDWGQDNGVGEMTKVTGEDDLWKLDLSPSIRQHFGVVTGGNIFRISCVFRSADGAVKGTQNAGDYGWGTVTPNQDNYLDLNVNAFVDITGPTQDEFFAVAGSTITLSANASSTAATLTMSVDAGAGFTQVEQLSNATSISYDYPVTSSESLTLRVEAEINGQAVSTEKELKVYVRTPTQTATIPANNRLGINYEADPTKATLVLEAPGKDFVYVIGDFNNWEAQEAYQMARDGDRFWLTLDGLEAGRDYVFQYWIDGEITIGDPYADQVADPWNDPFIEASVFPNIPAYAKTENNIATVLRTDQQPYQWGASEANWERPDIEHLVIYELHIRDFIETHNYQDLIDTLDYIKRLGVEAIELMPINEFEGNDSWGYNPSFFFAPDKYYGTKNDLKAFIEACHSKGLAVINDIVLNHAFGQNPMVRMYFEGGQPTEENPWFNKEYVGQYQWGYDFDHESSYTQAFVDSVNRYWLEEYHFDGFRFDFTKGFTNSAPGGSVDGYDASRIALLKRMADKIWETDQDAYIILEHWAPANEERELADYGMKMWRNRSYDYVPATVGRPGNSFNDMDATSHVSLISSHDERRVAEHCLTEGVSEASYHVRSPEVMYERLKQTAAFTYLVPGPKMIWQFDELGYDIDINFNGRTGRKPYVWGNSGNGYYYDEQRQHIYTTYSALLDLRSRIDVKKLASANTDHQLSGNARRMVFDTDSINLVVIGNFGTAEEELSGKFPSSGTWFNYFSGEEYIVSNPDVELSLKPGEWHVFTSERMSNGFAEAVETFIDPVTITPYPFNVDEPITITFDATKASPDGTAGLVDASNVYFHAGLVTDDAYGTNWAYTSGTLSPSGPGKMTPGAEPNTWELKITPRDYFSLPEDVQALRLGMYFHEGSNTARGKGFRDADVYFNVESAEPLLTITPFPFKGDEEISVVFNAARGNRELIDATSIYVHSSTAPNPTTNPEADTWDRVIGNWGQDDGIGKMTRQGSTNKWSINFTPNDYYDLSGDEFPHWLGMVFRNADGSKKGTASPGDYEFGFIADNLDFFIENPMVADTSIAGSLLVYPNPVVGTSITIEGVPAGSEVQVYTRDGRLIFDGPMDANKLDVEGLTRGIYFFRIESGDQQVTGKFMR